jgi:hypothetical protein
VSTDSELTREETDALHREFGVQATANLVRLLDKLPPYVERAAGKRFTDLDRRLLKETIIEAKQIYRGIRYLLDQRHSRPTLRELSTPLARVIGILKNEVNYESVLIALGAPVILGRSPDQQAVQQAKARYETVLCALDDIAGAVPLFPPKPGKGNRPKTMDLRGAVEVLAAYWAHATRKPFKQDWAPSKAKIPYTGKEPKKMKAKRNCLVPPKNKSRGTRFICDVVVEFIDPKRLDELPGVIEAVVTDGPASSAKFFAKVFADNKVSSAEHQPPKPEA